MESAVRGAELAEVAVFMGVSPDDLEAIAATMVKVQVRPGLQLLRKGEPGFEFFVVLEGSARVSDQGVPAAVLQPGDVFGEMALLGGTPRTADVDATSPMTLGMMMVWSFRTLLDEHPQVRERLEQLAAERS